ncbi:MAG: beta-N-acetylhexosaminidase [Elstera sp.]
MSMSYDFGLHFLIGLQPSPTLTAHDQALLAEVRPAGITLFKGNFDRDQPEAIWRRRLADLLKRAQDAIRREKILVALDHEGGRVHRTPAGITHFPPARAYADRAEAVATVMAAELQSIGVNFILAPCCDIDSNPQNPVIGDRSFGPDADSVTQAALAFLRGLKAAGMIGCAKHFPGHGDTDLDSHHALPRLPFSTAELAARELLPFKALIAAGVPAVMTAHILFPAVAGDLPATLSPDILTGILRQQLGFSGVIVSDDLGMKAIAPWFDAPEAAVQAVLAGCDLLCICAAQADTGKTRSMRNALAHATETALQSGTGFAAAARDSQTRVALLLNRLKV